MCQAAARSGSYAEAARDLRLYAGVEIETRAFDRMVEGVAPVLCEALESLPPMVHLEPIPVLYSAPMALACRCAARSWRDALAAGTHNILYTSWSRHRLHIVHEASLKTVPFAARMEASLLPFSCPRERMSFGA